MIPEISIEALQPARSAVDPEALRVATEIGAALQRDGEAGLRRYAERFDGLAPGAPLMFDRPQLAAAFAGLPAEQQDLLQRVAARIRDFAEAQLECLAPLETRVGELRCGHELVPLHRVACYAPGGRYPLPSSVLMTAIPAVVAGVQEVYVASPRPAAVTLAAAHVAGVQGLAPVGGAQAVFALARGAGVIPACDKIVGPGNSFVTAAKQLVRAEVGIDMLAGPSELVVVADSEADAELVAADLIAQAEHDPEARAYLLSSCPSLLAAVQEALRKQLSDLPSAAIASQALASSAAVVAPLEALQGAVEALAPEHLELHLSDPQGFAARVRHAGALFLGAGAAEVLGDYGAGPNHVLPTGGQARQGAGLAVFDFLRVRTFVAGRPDRALLADCAALADLEGLAGHARAARLRIPRDGR